MLGKVVELVHASAQRHLLMLVTAASNSARDRGVKLVGIEDVCAVGGGPLASGWSLL